MKHDVYNPARDYKKALENLEHAGLVYLVNDTRANGIPLLTEVDERCFKITYLDVGLMQQALNVDHTQLQHIDLLNIHRGDIAEQFVGQELLAYSDVN